MSALLEFQRRVAGAVMSPINASIGTDANELVIPNDRLTSTERLDIYHRQYWYRILDSFSEDFPGLSAVLGDPGLRTAVARLSGRLPVAVVYVAEPGFTARKLAYDSFRIRGEEPGARARHDSAGMGAHRSF